MSSPVRPLARTELTHAWSDAVSPTAEAPLPDEAIEKSLRDQLEVLIDALGQAPFSPEHATEVGANLVAAGFTGEQALGRTIEILGHALTELPELRTVEGLTTKVITLLGALASGYAAALHHHDFEQSEARFQEVFDSAPVGMTISRLDGTVTWTNGALTEILQYPRTELTGRDIGELFHPDHATTLRAAYQGLSAGKPTPLRRSRAKLLAANGDTTLATLIVSVLRDAAGSPTHHVTMIQDVTDVHLLEQRVRHQSLHDLLTGLPNRLHFAIHLEALLERERHAAVTLCKIDLDCFGIVNDGLGQGVGDLLLRSVAGRLQALVAGERAMVARFGADEFAIVIEESPTTPNAASLAASINAELSEPVYLAGRGLAVSACVGIMRRTAGETDAKELIRAAESTLHQAKRTGRGQWALYDPPADAERRARYALATAMPEAWESGHLTLYYQSLVRLDPAAADAGRIVALAALLRWDHPERGVVAHEDCVALAEQTGLILSIGPWMLREACEQLRSWRDQLGAAAPPVRVDLTSYLTQDPDLVSVVRGAMDAAQLASEDIHLGMPVEVIVAGHGDAVDNVGTLADIGVATVLTRYGQAVGNLTLLESLPVRGVELAGSLVHIAAQADSVLGSALAGLVPLMRRTGTTVAVAGIDDSAQADWWRHTGADCARGAAFAPPMAPQDVPALLRV
ncbi:MAG: EAL domain-containing protein [Actinomycetota bacterium]|nr:EAL domain-containing protein [Actinomycetota bacterium]